MKLYLLFFETEREWEGEESVLFGVYSSAFERDVAKKMYDELRKLPNDDRPAVLRIAGDKQYYYEMDVDLNVSYHTKT